MHPMPSCGTVLSYGLLPPALAPESPAPNPPVLSGNVTSVRNNVFAGKIFFFYLPRADHQIPRMQSGWHWPQSGAKGET